MKIEEMKANGYTRYTACIEKLIITKEVEVWAKDWDDARAILEEAAERLPLSAFENGEYPEVQQLERSPEPPPSIAAAQSIIADCNEHFYDTAREKVFMKFDKTRVYTAVNADELPTGSKCIFANTVEELKKSFKERHISTLCDIGDESMPELFIGSDGYVEVTYSFAYLIEPPQT